MPSFSYQIHLQLCREKIRFNLEYHPQVSELSYDDDDNDDDYAHTSQSNFKLCMKKSSILEN
jgi:hypothetical protein